jgi:phospholipid transport system substrate-binding protein
MLTVVGGNALAAGDTPGEIVNARTQSVLATLVERREEFQTEPRKLTAFVKGELDGIMDREYSAQLVLGRHARDASADQIQAFADALTDGLLRKYGDALLQFDPNLDVQVKSETPLRNGQLVRVASQILRKGGSPVTVDYMFKRDKSDTWKVFDVIVEGISYVQTYRNQFDELLRNQSIEQVTAKLRAGELKAEG